MGLFDKKFCDICGDKINVLTQKKLSDGQLCADCKHKLGSFTSGWKQRTVQDVKNHLEQREQNKQKFQRFSCTATAGGRVNGIQVDFNNRWFIFALDNRDFKSGNPQVFDFSQLQDFWLEQEYRTLNDSDHDGIPDNRDNFDNRQLNNNHVGFGSTINGMNNMMNMNSSMLNVPLSAQPFIRNTSSYATPGQIREVSNIKACFKVSDPYIVDPITFSATNSITSGNQMELMNAYDIAVKIMQLCQQIKQGGTQMNQGYAPAQPAYAQPAYAQPVTPQPTAPAANMGGSWVCAACGTANGGKFCQSCGSPKPAAPSGRCPNCGWMSNDPNNMTKFCPECGTKLN